MSAQPAVSLDRLVKRYRDRPSWRDLARLRLGETREVLHGVSCEIGRGELFGLLGPNGAGKTTLLKVLATLVAPDGGSVRVHGMDVIEDAARVRRLVGSVPPEERSLFYRLTARENLIVFADLHGLSEPARSRRVTELLRLVGLKASGRKIVGDFSSGMRQRLLIARSLLHEPAVLLLDEPTRSLDPMAARDLRGFLREELCDRLGCTVLLATHDPEEALHLCDRVGILDRGMLRAVGRAAELASRYGADRLRLTARELTTVHLDDLVERGVIAGWRRLSDHAAEWRTYELLGCGGPEVSSTVTGDLVRRGAEVATVEPVVASLADLIERVTEGRTQRPDFHPGVSPSAPTTGSGVSTRRSDRRANRSGRKAAGGGR